MNLSINEIQKKIGELDIQRKAIEESKKELSMNIKKLDSKINSFNGKTLIATQKMTSALNQILKGN